MVSKTVTVTDPEGLHMRPAGVFTKEMSKFDSDVTIILTERVLMEKA